MGKETILILREELEAILRHAVGRPIQSLVQAENDLLIIEKWSLKILGKEAK